MAVEAVGYVVIEKLTDMVNEESIMGQELIVRRLERIREDLVKMKGYFIDAEEKQGNDSIKNWADEYLKSVYNVEDTIEIFAFRISSPCAWRGFSVFSAVSVPLRNFRACRLLNRKMKKIQKDIKHLENKKPHEVADASLRALHSTNPREVDHHGKAIAEEEEEEEEEAEEEGNGVSAESGDKNDASTSLDGDRLGRPLRKQNSEGSPRGEWGKIYAVIRERLLLPSRLMSISSYDADELDIVGFKNYLSKLAAELKKESRRGPRFVSIFGEIGSGKTTLAQALLVSKGVRDHFRHCCVLLSVSPDSTPEKILLKLLNQVESSKDQGGVVTLDGLIARLSVHLKDKRYLIVLDNVSAKDTWDGLRDAFREIGHGGKIIVTTCKEEVANAADMKFVLKGLNEDESSELLVKKAGVKELPEEPKKAILDRCNGLPLNIVLLGSLLSTKKKGDYERLSSVLCQQQELSNMEILAFCYNDLPRDLQLCMLYMVVFPRDYDIPVRRLLRLWLAEGFIKRHKGFVEDVAQQYFDDLFQRSLIQVSKQRSDGSHRKKCRLLGTLHDFLSSKASDISLFHIGGSENKFGARRLVEHVDSEDSLKGISRPEYIRSYLSFNFQKKDIPAVEVGNLLKKMIRKRVRLLRVLDLEGVYKPSLPENLGDFFHLRYLGLRWTFLDVLPLSVGELTHLETLDIKHTYVNSLPSSLWKLKCLRHLNLNETRVEKPVAHPLPQLLTLWGLSIVKSECLVSVKEELKDLRELGITFNFTDSDSLLDWISSLTSLQQLRLRSKDDAGRPSKLDLKSKSFSRLINLSNMNLLGHLRTLPTIDAFPKNVKVLSLSVSLLGEDPMPTLGQLQKLTVLRLLANSYLGEKLECPKGGFPELRVLKLWMLRNLKEWVLEKGAMEKLEELNVRCCPRLESIPAALLSQRAFNQLTVSNMPEPFVKYSEKNKSTRFSLIVKNYEFKPLPWEDGDDSFDGMIPSAANANGF